MYRVTDISFLINIGSEGWFQRQRKGIVAEEKTADRGIIWLIYIFMVFSGYLLKNSVILICFYCNWLI